MSELRSKWQFNLYRQVSVCLACTALVIWSFYWSEFSLQALTESGPRFSEFFRRLVPPDWSITKVILHSTLETLMIALAGTALGVVVSLPLGFLAAANVSPPWLSHSVKWMLGVIRSIPLIMVAILFVVAVGLGPFPGALAIAFHSIGMLAKFYAEEFETAESGIINAVSGTGATRLQTLRFGLFPQAVPQLISFTIYRFEMNFRDATVLGLVGAGGVGYYIQLYIRSFHYDRVAVLLLVIIAVVTVLDQFAFWARRRWLPVR